MFEKNHLILVYHPNMRNAEQSEVPVLADFIHWLSEIP